MNWSTIALAFLVGWLLGVWQSHRKVERDRRRQARDLGKRLWDVLEKAEVIKFTVTESGEKELQFDQEGFDELLGNKPTKH